MALNKIELFNRAIGEAGGRALLVTGDENNSEARYCNLYYDPVRRMLLRVAPWNCARKILPMVEIGTLAEETSVYPWGYMYEYPEDCVKFRSLTASAPVDAAPVSSGDLQYAPVYYPEGRYNFTIGNVDGARVILSNATNISGIYNFDNEDTETFDSGLEDAIVAALAAKLSIPLGGKLNLKQLLIAEAKEVIKSARVSDGNEVPRSVDHVPDWIAGRGDGGVSAGAAVGMFIVPWDTYNG